MPNFKVVLQFTQPNKGWTEVYYRTATDLATAATIPPAFISSSLFIRQTLTTLAKIRVSDVVNNRSSLVVQVNQTGPAGLTGPEVAGVAAVVNLSSTAVPSSRKLWVRGLLDTDVTRNAVSGIDTPSAGLLAALNGFITQLGINGWVIRSLTRVGPPPNNYISILSVGVVAGAGQVTLNTIAGPVYPAGTLLLINQVSQKQLPGLKGIFPVISSTATTVVIPYNGTVTEIVTLTKGRFRVATYNFGAINPATSGFSNFGTRSTGKNPLGGRGAKRGARGIRSA